MHACVRVSACLRDPVSGHAMFNEPIVQVRGIFPWALGLHSMALLFEAFFDTVDEGQEARPKKLLKSKIQASRSRQGLATTTLKYLFNVAQMALQTPVPELLRRPPSEPIRLGSNFAGYGTDRLACH